MENTHIDLALVHPGNRRKIYQSLGDRLSAIETPVWALMIATFVRNQGWSVAIVDAEADDLTAEEVANQITDLKPTLTAVVAYGHQPSASTQNMTVSGEICTALRQISPELKTIIVGGHVAALPERTLREEQSDYVSTGEGPFTVLELLQALNSSSPKLSKVRGLMYWEDAQIITNPPAPLLGRIRCRQYTTQGARRSGLGEASGRLPLRPL